MEDYKKYYEEDKHLSYEEQSYWSMEKISEEEWPKFKSTWPNSFQKRVFKWNGILQVLKQSRLDIKVVEQKL